MINYLLVFFVLFITACHRTTSDNTMTVTLAVKEKTNPEKNIQPNHSLNSTIVINQNKLINVVSKEVMPRHTDCIGTEENPTIDGGILNAADGLLINHVEEVKSQAAAQKPAWTPPIDKFNSVKQAMNVDKDNEAWATSPKLKSLLIQAAEKGKLDAVLKKSEHLGLPPAVAIVPMVESRYQENALSSKGAAGAWQIMPSVAKAYGIDNPSRFEFTTATDIALQHLNKLHQQFGRWELAFAAYNAGSARLQKALRENPTATSLNELALPLETKQYVTHIKTLAQALTHYVD